MLSSAKTEHLFSEFRKIERNGANTMGQKSSRLNKSIYLTSRESADLTREEASERMGWVSASKIEKIENGKQPADPATVLAMAECYKDATLCNHYCACECEIGQKYVPKVEVKELSQITLEMLSNINALSKSKERLIDITVDGQISEDEIPDFLQITESLDKMSLIIDSLQLWLDNAVSAGKVDDSVLQ